MDKLKHLDKRPKQINLNFNSIESYQSKTGGFLSLLYILFALVIFSLKTNHVIQRKTIFVTQTIFKEDDYDQLDISSGNFSLALFVYNQTTKQLFNNSMQSSALDELSQKCFKPVENKPIKFTQLSAYGLQIVFGNHSFSQDEKGNLFENYTQDLMEQCKDNEFRACFPSPTQQKQYIVRGRLDYSRDKRLPGEIYRRYSIIVRHCNATKDKICNSSFQGYFTYGFFFFNNRVIANATKDKQPVEKEEFPRVFQSHSRIDTTSNTKNITSSLNLFFKKAAIQTDDSINPTFIIQPTYNIKQSWFYDEEYFEQTNPPVDNILLQIYLKRSIYTHVYTRSCQKIDQIMGSFFGLLSLAAMFAFGIYQGYNGWCFEQQIKKNLGLQYTTPNLLKFYYVKIGRIFRFICCRSQKQKQKIQTDKNNSEIVEQKLDYMRLVRLLQQIQANVRKMQNMLIQLKKGSEKTDYLPINQQNSSNLILGNYENSRISKKRKRIQKQEKHQKDEKDEEEMKQKLIGGSRFSLNDEFSENYNNDE